jgi:L-lactate dehydrogenase complex protein LldF
MSLPVLPNTATRKASDVTLAKRAEQAAKLPWEKLRDEATETRRDSVENLDALLAQFVGNAEAGGFRVVHAADARAAREAVVAELGGVPGVVIKAKSMVTEEIGLRHHLEALSWRTYETDLGEWIVQERNELPAHITGPAMHLSAAEIAATLSKVLKRDLPADPEALARAATEFLGEPLRQAGVGISGANFLIAETGEIVIIENEGNAFFCSSAAKHVVVTGIDKVIRSRASLPALLRLLTISATGQPQTVYTHVIGRRVEGDADRTIVLVDNGRRALAASEDAEAARCIRCGACMVACPVFRQASGHGYETVYPGPIGIVVAPYLEPGRVPEDAPYYSTLCGACSDICPVRIPISDLIARRREKLWREGRAPAAVRHAIALWKRAQRGTPDGRVLRPLLLLALRSKVLRRLAQLTRPSGRR